MNPPARLSTVVVLALFSGCSSFQKKWDAVGQPGKYEHASRWDGRWTSARHKSASGPAGGRLRCVIEPVADSRVLAHFRANWEAFSANYDVTFEPKSKRGGEVREFRGSHDLPKIFGGTYRYDARIAGDRFSARYDSSYDSGTFQLTRQLTDAMPIH